MSKAIRSKAGLGSPPVKFTTNRVESMNQLLKLETEKKKMTVYDLAVKVQELVERQQRNVNWAVAGMYDYIFIRKCKLIIERCIVKC